jgi:hypothetical protein
MPHRIEQPTLFELTACDGFEPRLGSALEPASPSMDPNSDGSTPEGNVASGEAGVFRAVSPWASMPLHEVCAACGREIRGNGFVILDYEELGAFCNQGCADRRFRSYLYEISDEGHPK